MEETKNPEVQAMLKMLTDQDLRSLFSKFTSNADLKKLAVFGLKMEKHLVEKHINNEKGDISSAAHKVLQDWRKSIENPKVVYKQLYDALGVAEMGGVRGDLLLGGPSLDLTENLNNALDLTENLNNAYVKACQEGSEEIFVARMNLVGYSGGGKSSLANRLMGDEFSQDIKSTEGIAIHRLKSFFNLQEDVSSDWQETSRDAEELFKLFSHSVMARINERSTKKAGYSSTSTLATMPFHEHEGLEQPQKTEVHELVETSTEKPLQSVPVMDEHTKTQILKHQYDTPEYSSDDRIPFSLTLWDLGGQDDFMATHHLFLHADVTTLIVMDITQKLHQPLQQNTKFGSPNTPAEVLCYWLNSIHIQARDQGVKPEIALVLTHKDLISFEDKSHYIQSYINDIFKAVHKKPYAELIRHENIYVVDNTLDQLKRGLVTQTSLAELWPGEDVYFLVSLMLKFNLFLPLKQYTRVGQSYIIPCMLPPYNTNDMEPFMDMVCLYAASQKALFGDNMLVATFHKLLSSLTITTQWDLSRKEPLSYSEASLDIEKSPVKENLLQLRLTLSKGNEIESSIWCHRDKMTKDLTPAITSIKEVLFRRMAALNVGPPQDVLVLCPHFRPADNSSCMVKGDEIQNFRVKLHEEKCREHRKALPTDSYSWLFSMYPNYIHCVF